MTYTKATTILRFFSQYKNIVFLFCLLFCLTGCISEERQDTPAEPAPPASETFHIIAMGDSLTEGLGLEDQTDSYPDQLEKKLIESDLSVRMTNAGVSGETSAGGARRAEWIAAQKPDLLILFIGSNDALRGIPPEETKKNITNIINTFEEKQIPILVIETKPPQSMGNEYMQKTANIYTKLSEKKDISVIDFPLEKVLFNPEFVQNDGIHPNTKGYEIMVEEIFPSVLEEIQLLME